MRLLVLATLTGLVACGGPPPPAAASPDPTWDTLPAVIHRADGLVLGHAVVEVPDDDPFHVVTVTLPRDAVVTVTPADGVVRFRSLLPTDDGPWVAVNGGFYGADGQPLGLVLSDGKLWHALGRSAGGTGVLLGAPGPAAVVHRDAYTEGRAHAVQSIDRLVDAGQSLVKPAAGARHAARTAVAITADSVVFAVGFDPTYASLAADGITLRATAGTGPTLAAFADWLVAGLHAEQALNLDGAISTQLAVRARGFHWDVEGEAGTPHAVVGRPGASRP